jgi:O-antigen/teichoic acid export membrane protein
VRDVSPAAFARLQSDRPALRKAFLSSVGLLTAVTLPVCLVVTGAAGPIVKVVYGPEWSQAADALAWLGVLAGLRILFELFYDFFVVLGSSRAVFAVQLAWLVVLAPALYVGARADGIAGAAAAHVLVATLVVLPLYLRELHRAEIGWRPLLKRVLAPLVSGTAAAVVALTARELISPDLVALAVAGAGVVAVLGLSARRMRATVAQLRTVGSVSVG